MARRLRSVDRPAGDEPATEGPISEFPDEARRDARRSFDGQLAGVDRCDVVIDSALSEPLDGHPRRIQFVGSTLTITATCSRATSSARWVTIEVTDTEAGIPSGRCRLTVLGEARLDSLVHAVTDDQGRVRLAIPDAVVSLLVVRADEVAGQTAWLRF